MNSPSSAETSRQTPASLGYAMPAEWAPHEATWLTWPGNLITWPDGRLEIVERSYLKMIESLLPHEKVRLIVRSAAEREKVEKGLKGAGSLTRNLVFYEKPAVDSWIRDYGPTYLKGKDGSRAWCKWRFNAWGGKYEDLLPDNDLFLDTSLVQGRCFPKDIVLEGGSIEVDGAGTCLTTEQCLLNTNRNPHLSRNEIEQILKDYLGVEQVLWLKEGVMGDDTDGHIDDISRFAAPNVIVSAYEENVSDPNHAILKHNWELLEGMRNLKGGKWDLVKLPMPSPIIEEGEPLPASYANFYIANKTVLAPVFDDPKDKEALSILKDLFPARTIVPIPCREVVYGMGTVHCLSQQEPAAEIAF
jgi:agmatine deiminase